MHAISKMADADDHFRGETLDIIFNLLDEDIYDEALEEEFELTLREVRLKIKINFLIDYLG